MQNYKDPNNKVHVLSDDDISNGWEARLPPGCVRISSDEAEILLRPAPLSDAEKSELRRAAYISESDPLKNEAEYDSIISGQPPDYSKWIDKVREIKARYS